jgi:hypothetical protein
MEPRRRPGPVLLWALELEGATTVVSSVLPLQLLVPDSSEEEMARVFVGTLALVAAAGRVCAVIDVDALALQDVRARG